MSEDLGVCGESFDHDLKVISEGDGMTVYECRRCGAEVADYSEAPSDD